MCAFVVLGLVFPHQAKRLACRTSPIWPILCRAGRKTLTQSIISKVSVLKQVEEETKGSWLIQVHLENGR